MKKDETKWKQQITENRSQRLSTWPRSVWGKESTSFRKIPGRFQEAPGRCPGACMMEGRLWCFLIFVVSYLFGGVSYFLRCVLVLGFIIPFGGFLCSEVCSYLGLLWSFWGFLRLPLRSLFSSFSYSSSSFLLVILLFVFCFFLRIIITINVVLTIYIGAPAVQAAACCLFLYLA